MNLDEKISIILPAYNAEKYIKRTIDSLLVQTYENIEIICINDGSKDSTLDILNEFHKKDSRVVIIDKKNEGVWRARFDGIKIASGEYLTFIDSDDYVDSTFIEKLYSSISENKSDIAICGFRRIDEKTGKVLSSEMKFDKSRIITRDTNFEEIISINTALWNKMYKTSIVKNVKNIEKPPRILEDMMFLAMAYQNVEKISFVDDYLYNYIVREGSLMNTIKENEVIVLQNSMLEVKEIYNKGRSSKEANEILSSMAFLHFGISLMLLVSKDKNSNFKLEYKKNLKYLNDNFSEWKSTKYLKLLYCLRKKSSNLKVAIVKKVYMLHMFSAFISVYKFVTSKLKIDIKW